MVQRSEHGKEWGPMLSSDSMSSTKYKTITLQDSLSESDDNSVLPPKNTSGPDFPETRRAEPHPSVGCLGLTAFPGLPGPRTLPSSSETHTQSLERPLMASLLPPRVCDSQLSTLSLQGSALGTRTAHRQIAHVRIYDSKMIKGHQQQKTVFFTLRLLFVMYTYKSQ